MRRSHDPDTVPAQSTFSLLRRDSPCAKLMAKLNLEGLRTQLYPKSQRRARGSLCQKNYLLFENYLVGRYLVVPASIVLRNTKIIPALHMHR